MRPVVCLVTSLNSLNFDLIEHICKDRCGKISPELSSSMSEIQDKSFRTPNKRYSYPNIVMEQTLTISFDDSTSFNSQLLRLKGGHLTLKLSLFSI